MLMILLSTLIVIRQQLELAFELESDLRDTYQIFIFSPSDSPLKTMKNIFIEKAIFVLEIQIFVIFYLPFHTFQIQKGK